MIRLLRYWARVGCQHQILIGDSSDGDHGDLTRAAIAGLKGRLAVRYEPCPGLITAACFERLSQMVTTPYTTFVADDDFLVPSAIDRCAQHLAAHEECSGVHGRSLIVDLEQSGAYGPVRSVRRYPQSVIRSSTGVGRLREYFTTSLAAVVYAVHRTEDWRDMFRGIINMPWTAKRNIHKEIFRDELLPSAVSVVRGRIVELDDLYLVRQAHDGIYRQPDAYDWITDPIWYPSYQAFRDRIIDELISADGVSGEQAEAVVREVLEPFLARYMTASWHGSRLSASKVTGPSARLRAIAKRLRPLRALRVQLKKWGVLRTRGENLLVELLSRSSADHAAFLPIYESLTQTEPGRRAGGSEAPGASPAASQDEEQAA